MKAMEATENRRGEDAVTTFVWLFSEVVFPDMKMLNMLNDAILGHKKSVA